ncbi:MAG TPA: hypothetical protein VHC86_12545 [Opitutaceae bacterium]|nr:hypothetical protein [Opitutaceae bacterium]
MNPDLVAPLLRGARPDAEAAGRLYLIKRVSRLRATYQIRLLAFLAEERGRQLVLQVPAGCRFEPDLLGLVQARPGVIAREDLP